MCGVCGVCDEWREGSVVGISTLTSFFTLTSLYPHILTSLHPHILIPSYPHIITPSHPHTDTTTEALGIISEAADRTNDRIKELVYVHVWCVWCVVCGVCGVCSVWCVCMCACVVCVYM